MISNSKTSICCELSQKESGQMQDRVNKDPMLILQCYDDSKGEWCDVSCSSNRDELIQEINQICKNNYYVDDDFRIIPYYTIKE